MSENPYWYWYAFLKQSVKYRECCLNNGCGQLSELYKDFGDVLALSWEEWWDMHSNLFQKEKRWFVEEIKSRTDFDNLFEEGAEDLMAVVVNLYEPKEAVMKAFKERLRARNSLGQGRPKPDASFYHRYGMTPMPGSRTLKMLEISLDVYIRCIHEDEEPQGLTRYEIGDLAGISFPNNINKQSGKEMTEAEKRNRMTATVGRYFRWAKEIIANVENGEFPRHN